MSKILFLVNHDVVIYNFRLELVEELLTLGYEVHISSPFGERINDLMRLGCTYHETNISRHGTNPLKDFALLKKYIKILKQVKPDYVFTYTIKPNIYGGIACRMRKVKYASNVTGLGNSFYKSGLLAIIAKKLYKFSQKKASKVFFQNKSNMDFFLKNKIIKDRYSLLPGSGVNLKKNYFVKYPINNGEIKFLFIGRLMSEKGYSEYVKAAKIIKEKYNFVKFESIGFLEENYKDEFLNLECDKYVNHYGMVRNVHDYIKNAHCIVLPSYHEGMANVLLEAAATGRPIIASNIPGCKETMIQNESGFLCDPKSVKSLVEFLEKFILLSYEKKERMGISGRLYVEKNFDRNYVIKEYLDLL